MKNKKYRSIFSYILLFISNYFLEVDEITGVILVFFLRRFRFIYSFPKFFSTIFSPIRIIVLGCVSNRHLWWIVSKKCDFVCVKFLISTVK